MQISPCSDASGLETQDAFSRGKLLVHVRAAQNGWGDAMTQIEILTILFSVNWILHMTGVCGIPFLAQILSSESLQPHKE